LICASSVSPKVSRSLAWLTIAPTMLIVSWYIYTAS
jgi:hypothetical protein